MTTCTCPTCGQEVEASAEVRWDHLSGVLFAGGKSVQLTPRCADIFEVLYRAAPAPVHIKDLFRAVYGTWLEDGASRVAIHVRIPEIRAALRGTGLHIACKTKRRGYQVVFTEAAPEEVVPMVAQRGSGK